jgi:hypothetical protein
MRNAFIYDRLRAGREASEREAARPHLQLPVHQPLVPERVEPETKSDRGSAEIDFRIG